jgi:hypothetical protein
VHPHVRLFGKISPALLIGVGVAESHAFTEAGHSRRFASRSRSLAIVGKPTTKRPPSNELSSVTDETVQMITAVLHLEITAASCAGSEVSAGLSCSDDDALPATMEDLDASGNSSISDACAC